MKTAKIITNTPELSFERFKDAVRHIASVPKAKVLDLEKRNGRSANTNNGRKQHGQ